MTTITYPRDKSIINREQSRKAEGAANPRSPIYCAVKSQNQTVESQMGLTDSSGLWAVNFGKALPVGTYAMHATQLPDRQSQTNPDAIPPDATITFTVVESK